MIQYRVARLFDGTSETPSLFGTLRTECAAYSKGAAERAISILAPFAKVMSERKTLSNNVIDTIRTYIQRRGEGEGDEKEDARYMADALLILDKFAK